MTSNMLAAATNRYESYNIFVIIKALHENNSMAVGHKLYNLWLLRLRKDPFAKSSLDLYNILYGKEGIK